MDSKLHAEQEVPSGILTRIRFNILTEEDAEKASVKEIRSGNEVTDPALGIPNPSSQCSTCGAKDGRNCEGHFGLIKFPFTILHPYFLPEVAQILNKICPGCKSIWRDKVKRAVLTATDSGPRSCKYCDGSSKEIYPPMKFRVSAKDVFGKTAIIAEVNEKLSKKGGGLAPDYWDFIPNDPQQGENYLKPNKRVISHAQVYNMLKDVDPRFLEGFLSKKNSIFLNSFPVTPNCHRVTEFGHNVMFDECTRAYKRLIDFRGSANELSTRVLECLKISKVRREKPSTTDTASNFTPKASGLKYIKEIILGKRTDHIFRMVVVGDPNIKLDEIGIPCHIAEAMQISEQLNSWNLRKLMNSCYLRILEKGQTLVRRKGTLVRHGITDKLQIGDTVYRPLNDGDVVLINRPPAIHPHSLLALSVKILPINSVLSVNPLICSPLRGDFDGDCLHGYVPQSVDCRVELRELAALNKQLINGQSGRNLLSLSHDSLTAAHLLLEDGVLLNKYQMQQLQMFCPRQLQIPSIIKAQSLDDYFNATSSNSCLWTGKQLFSLLLPPDFDYSFPSNGVHVSKGELVSSSGGSSWLRDIEENLFCSLVKHCQEDVLDFLYAAQEVFCEWLSMRGLSVSLSDLYLSPDSNSRQNMTDEVSCGLQEAKRVSHIKLLMVDSNRDFLIESSQETEIVKSFGAESMCYEQQTSAALSRASVSAFKQIFWDIQNLAYQYSSKENSFLAMLKAGSKGNLLKLVQHSMCLGLQHSLVPLSFRFPHQLSCAAWNNQKSISTFHRAHDIVEHAESYIPFAVVENSFLTGLNPLEFFVHSVTTRDNSFGGHADISGTLNRKLMFFMRDLYVGYDGTVRNAYGNQLVQFSYNVDDMSSPSNSPNSSLNDTVYNCQIGGKPVGSLAASAISEAAYCALDQPFSALESSPLLNLKNVLECGVKKSSGDNTASLFLSKKLGRWIHGFEYGALEVKSHLERVLFSEIVSAVMVFFSPETRSRTRGPWICHFHISKEMAEKKRLKVQVIIHALCIKCNCDLAKSRINFPKLQITSNDCTEMQNEKDATICIAVSVYGSPKSSSVGLNMIRDLVIPFLLGTVIKGSPNVKKVDILWKDGPNVSRSRRSSDGEIYLRVFMSENCNRKEFWRVVMDDCLRIMDMIDWQRSHPDDIHDLTLAHGIDVARKYFLSRLKSAISDIGKNILPQHLLLATDCLSATGEFVSLSVKGLAQQRKNTSVSSPFVQACFSNPADCFTKAAKMGLVDDLQGSVDSLAWGNVPSFGTGGPFDILYSGKGKELAKSEDVYKLLGSQVKVTEPEELQMSNKYLAQRACSYDDIEIKGQKRIEISKAILRKVISSEDIRRLSLTLRQMLHKYAINQRLSEVDEQIAMMALHFHPRWDEKIGNGAKEIKVGYHSEYENTRCFVLIRKDDTSEDFSYHKCVHHALEIVAPQRAKTYQSRWLNGSQ